MLNFIKSRQESQSTPAKTQKYVVAPGTSIRFNHRLIDQLTSEHQALLDCYIEVSKAAKSFDAPRVGKGLERMYSHLRAHVLSENVRLYIYLKHMLANDPHTSSLVREFRREMDEISRKAKAFFDKYADIGSGDHSLTDFAAEFEALGTVLNGQMEREECTLYPLYLPEY